MKKLYNVLGVLIVLGVLAVGFAACPDTPKGFVNVTGVHLEQTAISLTIGQTAQLSGYVTPKSANMQDLVWESSDEGVVRVDKNGKITAISEGDAEITASSYQDTRIKAECSVSVLALEWEWTVAANTGSVQFNRVAWGINGTDQLYVAVGNSSTIMESVDGILWNSKTGFASSRDVKDVAYGAGKFVAVGQRGTIAYRELSLAGSWNALTAGAGGFSTSALGTNFINGVAYGGEPGNEVFVAVGTGRAVAYSTDGTSWSNSEVSWSGNTTTFVLNCITWVNDEDNFFAGGVGGNIAYSIDGKTWSVVPGGTTGSNNTGTTANINGIAYGDGILVAVGNNGTIIYSTDFNSKWETARAAPAFTTSNAINDVIWSEDLHLFIAVGSSGRMGQSTDGVRWHTISNEFGSNAINGIVEEGEKDKFVAVGAAGRIIWGLEVIDEDDD